MTEDPIIQEVRRHRQARAAKFNYDIDAIAEDARKRERTSGHKVVPAPRPKAGRGTTRPDLRSMQQ